MFGLWGWNDFTKAVTGAAGWVHDHPAETAGIILGVAAAATGVGAVVELGAGAVALGVGLGVASLGTGAIATALDAGSCFRGGDSAACLGFGLGLGGVVLGAAATGGSIGTLAGVAAFGEDATGTAVLGGVGACGLNLGIGGTTIDIVNAIAHSNH